MPFFNEKTLDYRFDNQAFVGFRDPLSIFRENTRFSINTELFEMVGKVFAVCYLPMCFI
jgi:hypothetical protein